MVWYKFVKNSIWLILSVYVKVNLVQKLKIKRKLSPKSCVTLLGSLNSIF